MANNPKNNVSELIKNVSELMKKHNNKNVCFQCMAMVVWSEMHEEKKNIWLQNASIFHYYIKRNAKIIFQKPYNTIT